jgi:glucose/arabinose dehydrogenase
MPHPHRLASPGLALLLLLASLPAAHAADTPENARAQVHRHTPVQVPFSASTVKRLHVPPGFQVNVFAVGLRHPRMMEVAPDGTVFVTRRDEGDVLALRDADGDGRADMRRTVVANLSGVHGIALHEGRLYLASQTTIWRTTPAGGSLETIVSGLPDGGQHPNRMVRFGPDGMMYVSVGSSCNNCAEDNQLERATLMRYTPDGRERTIIANGLRNTIGYDWHPATGQLWGADHGSDFRGDHKPPEELNHIEAGWNYGWPLCFGDREVDAMSNVLTARLAAKPGHAEPIGKEIPRAQFCAATHPPALTLTAHSAPMALRFYRGGSFPAEYRDDAFMAMHGSWNRHDAVGYSIVRLRFDASGRPIAAEDFLTGFMDDDNLTMHGRPVGLGIARDGALLVSDDLNGVIYRIAYTGR